MADRCDACDGLGTIETGRMVPHQSCNGTGRLDFPTDCFNCQRGVIDCVVCHGSGKVVVDSELVYRDFYRDVLGTCGQCGGGGQMVCPHCKGTGQDWSCPLCHGTGKIRELIECSRCRGTGKAISPAKETAVNRDVNDSGVAQPLNRTSAVTPPTSQTTKLQMTREEAEVKDVLNVMYRMYIGRLRKSEDLDRLLGDARFFHGILNDESRRIIWDFINRLHYYWDQLK